MATTDLKFFTNEPDRDLYSRFSAILKSNTQFFDVLVGYFRSSGFFKLYDAMKDVEKIRILVGLNVDKYTVDIIDSANNELEYSTIPTIEGKKIIGQEVEKEFEQTNPSENIEKGVQVFIEWLKSGKLEMKMYTKAPVHAKVYIMRKDPTKVFDMFGSVITGSSNFSESGLVNNLEFNVELKDTADVEFALEKFEELWEESVDISDIYVESVEQNTWMRNDITPYQLYLKTLYEFFKEEINSDKESYQTLLPEGFMKLQYQMDAVTQARQKLDAYNGVFISDVVGLGKTYICAMLANSFNRNSYKLFICPPVLQDYWKSVLQEFDVSRWDVVSLGQLDKVIESGKVGKYSYVFVDEAHRFRNSDTNAFTSLHQICKGKKVVLISATPINNYTSDIENQLYLFQAKKNGTINGIKNLERFFADLKSKLNKKVKGSNEYMKQLRDNSEVIRDKILREVMVRRTRNEIVEYYGEDLKKQGLTFPKVGNPEKITYVFDEFIDDAFNQTIDIIKNFNYARYTPLLYLNDTKKYSTMLVSQTNMGGFMKGVLVKRLESSFYAFRKTLDRFLESYDKFIEMADSGKIFISKKINVYDLLDDGDTSKLMELVENEDVLEFDMKEFKSQFIRDLEQDRSQLKALRSIWANIDNDPKLEELKNNLINNSIIKGNKAIIFTESKETAEYLYEKLKEIYDSRIVYYSGESSPKLKSDIEDSFNPQKEMNNNDKYDLLITTDVLAEGINLHRSNILINYDLPWNPTRIMQRVGRVNRVGTKFDQIYVFNFFPTAQSKAQMPLEDRILEKLQAFHDTLGEDIKFLSEDEEVSSQRLFSELTGEMKEDESTNPELEYLKVIRDVRDNDPDLFEAIKKMPKKSKTGKKEESVDTTSTITFLRKGAYKSFFISDGINSEQIPFIKAIEKIKASPNDEKIQVASGYYRQFEQNSKAFDEILTEESNVTIEKTGVSGNDAVVVKLLKAMAKEKSFTDDQEELIKKWITLWENGEIPSKISKDIVKKSRNIGEGGLLEFFFEIKNIIPSVYLEDKQDIKATIDGEKQIVLSCYLVKDETNEA